MKRPRRRTIAMLALAASAAGVAAQRTAWAATSFSVIDNGMSSWLINGQSNPTLTLTKGQTYSFVISDQTMFGHPFWIATQRGAGDTGRIGLAALAGLLLLVAARMGRRRQKTMAAMRDSDQ